MYSLPPTAVMEIDTCFLGHSRKRGASSSPKSMRLQALSDADALREEDSGELVVTFSNGSVQRILLKAATLYPTLCLSPSRFDFGPVHVKDSKTIRIVVSNPTKVDARWRIEYQADRATPLEEGALSARDFVANDVFAFSESSGVLAGPTVPHDSGIVHSRLPKGTSKYLTGLPLMLTVTFNPALNGKYAAFFRFAVQGGKATEIFLTGQGTFDEACLEKSGW